MPVTSALIFPVTLKLTLKRNRASRAAYHPPKPGKHVPFIHSTGGLVDLNKLIPSDSGFTLTDAVGINDAG